MFKTKTETFTLQHSSVLGFFTTSTHSHNLAAKHGDAIQRMFGEELLDGKLWTVTVIRKGLKTAYKLQKQI